MDLPEELTFRIFSYLPGDVLKELCLTNKQYWNIYRLTTDISCLWNPAIHWIEKLYPTNEMVLGDQLYVMSISDLVNYVPTIPVEKHIKVSYRKCFDGYVWYPKELPIDFHKLQQILQHEDGTGLSGTGCYYTKYNKDVTDKKVLELFNKYIFKYWRERDDYDEDMYLSYYAKRRKRNIKNEAFLRARVLPKCHYIPFILYLKENPNLSKDNLDLVDELKVGDYVIWKVIKIDGYQERSDIGRAVLTPNDLCYMENNPGVGLFANGKYDGIDRDDLHYGEWWGTYEVFGFGNFHIPETEYDLIDPLVLYTGRRCINVVGF